MTLPFLPALISLLAVVPMSPSTHGGWTTYLFPVRYSDLLVKGDTVWCATREAGLLSYRRSQVRFGAITRFPNGLAGNELSCLAYDRSGRLWIGTMGTGASRMSANGASWTLVNAFDGLPSDTVNVLEAEGDSMWIGTPSGIAFWNGTAITGSLPIFGQPSPFGSDNVTGVVTHPETLFVSTSSGVYESDRRSGLQNWTAINDGLYNLDIKALVTNDTLLFCMAADRAWIYVNGAWDIYDGLGDVKRMVDDHGQVLVTTSTGVFRLCSGKTAAVICTDAVDDPYFGEVFIYSPAVTEDGRYIVANELGVSEQPSPTQYSGWPLATPDGPPSNDIRNINIDGNRVWVNTPSGGVGRLEGSTWRIWYPGGCGGASCDSTFSNAQEAWALLVDRTGHKWFGFWGHSVDEFNDLNSLAPPVVTHHVINDALGYAPHTWAWASAADSNGGRWFGMDTPLLGSLDPIGIEYYDASGAYIGNIRSGNSSNLLRGNKVHALTVDDKGALWFGLTGQGIGRLAPPKYGDPWAIPNIQYVTGSDRLDVQGLVARGDTLWALTTHELQRYNRRSLSLPIATYTIPEATPLFAANPLAVGPDGSPWVGTEAGIRVFHADGTSEDFNTSNSPIAGNQIYGIRVDPVSGVAWISTSSGMNRFDPGYRPPPPPQIAKLDASVYPNPVHLLRSGIQLRVDGNATGYRGSIYDLNGRRVRQFSAAENQSMIWNGLDDSGKQVKPGVYFVFIEAGGRSATLRVAVLR